MANITQQLTELKAQFADFASDVDARLSQLADAQGTFSPEAQQILDDLRATVQEADAKVGDADGSDTPGEGDTPGEPTDPATPVDPGTPDEGTTPGQ